MPKRFGGFLLERKLGQGGMGAVFLARQESIGRLVALKVLAAHIAGQPGMGERFLREARTAGRINHRNVVTLYDAGTHDGRYFMALEYVAGGDADQLAAAAGGRLPESRAFAIVADAARGLQALQHAGLLHRDIKPANIFIAADGTAKLGDLGLARTEDGGDRMTATGATVGTPAYMSPEQANGAADLDIRSDVYALGATLYALVCGEPPFIGATLWQVVHKVMTEPPPDARLKGAGEGCARIIAKALAKDPATRFQTPAELLAALTAAAAERAPPAVASAPTGRSAARRAGTRRTAAPSRRWPLAVAAGAAVAIAGIALVALRREPTASAAPPPASNSTPPAVPGGPTAVAAQAWLADLVPTRIVDIPDSANGDIWGFGVGRFGANGLPIRVRGVEYPRGLGLHPPGDGLPGEVEYRLDGASRRLEARVALHDAAYQGRPMNHSTVTFTVLGDGRELWHSRAFNGGDAPEACAVDLTGVRSLVLRVQPAGVFHYCQGVWLDPVLVSPSGSPATR